MRSTSSWNSLRNLAQRMVAGEVWVANVHCDQRIYLEDPWAPPRERRHRKGRTPSRAVLQRRAMRVDWWAAAQPDTASTPVPLRESTKGTLTVEVLRRHVWLWDGKAPNAHRWHLLVRREIGAPLQIKYTLSNGAATPPAQRLACRQGQRYGVEHALRNVRSEAGMGDYKLRLWLGWHHHHLAMVMLAILFMFEVPRAHQEALSLLSCHGAVKAPDA
jgi:SRSO17 transposase